jgi:hypothetical protein
MVQLQARARDPPPRQRAGLRCSVTMNLHRWRFADDLVPGARLEASVFRMERVKKVWVVLAMGYRDETMAHKKSAPHFGDESKYGPMDIYK